MCSLLAGMRAQGRWRGAAGSEHGGCTAPARRGPTASRPHPPLTRHEGQLIVWVGAYPQLSHLHLCGTTAGRQMHTGRVRAWYKWPRQARSAGALVGQGEAQKTHPPTSSSLHSRSRCRNRRKRRKTARAGRGGPAGWRRRMRAGCQCRPSVGRPTGSPSPLSLFFLWPPPSAPHQLLWALRGTVQIEDCIVYVRH